MLKDENNNLVLDAGEVISLHVEITNTGQTLLEGVTIDLTGTPAVVKAFTTITPHSRFRRLVSTGRDKNH